jgi:hypothetical protein
MRIEVSDLDGSLSARNTEKEVAGFQAAPFKSIAPSIEGVATEMLQILQRIGPTSAEIEFGIEMGVEAGQLTALLVKGTGKANVKITLHWEHATNSAPAS